MVTGYCVSSREGRRNDYTFFRAGGGIRVRSSMQLLSATFGKEIAINRVNTNST